MSVYIVLLFLVKGAILCECALCSCRFDSLKTRFLASLTSYFLLCFLGGIVVLLGEQSLCKVNLPAQNRFRNQT